MIRYASVLILAPIVFVIVNGNLIITLYNRNHLSLFNPLFLVFAAMPVYPAIFVWTYLDFPLFSFSDQLAPSFA